MKISKFTNSSLIAGVYIINLVIQDETTKRLRESKVSYLGGLIIAAIYFESKDKDSVIGPARLAHALKFSRSRISQEISKLDKEKLLIREINRSDSRGFNLKLTTKGEKAASSIIKVFNGIQRIVDSAIGEQKAESLCENLLVIAEKISSRRF